MEFGDDKNDKPFSISFTYDGSNSKEEIKLYYTKNIDGIDYRVREQDGKILHKIPLREIKYDSPEHDS